MSDEARGHAIKRRRLARGISQRELAEASGVARQTIARAEDGDSRTTEVTFARLEAFLDRLDGNDDNPAESSQPLADEAGGSPITFRASGVTSEAFSIDELIVDSTAEHADEARRQFVELIQEIRRAASSATDTERP